MNVFCHRAGIDISAEHCKATIETGEPECVGCEKGLVNPVDDPTDTLDSPDEAFLIGDPASTVSAKQEARGQKLKGFVPCDTLNCEGNVYALGFCRSCYQKKRRRENPKPALTSNGENLKKKVDAKAKPALKQAAPVVAKETADRFDNLFNFCLALILTSPMCQEDKSAAILWIESLRENS